MNKVKRFFSIINKKAKYIDYSLLVTYVLLCLIGLVMVYSASMVAATKGSLTGGVPVSGTYFYTRQLAYVIVGFAIVFFMAFFFNTKLLQQTKIQQIMVVGIIILLVATLIFGSNINGSKSWLRLGVINLQVSEFLKLVIILYIPFMIEKRRAQVFRDPKIMFAPVGLMFFAIGLVLIQRDLGQVMLLTIILLAILFYAGLGVKIALKWAVPIIFIIAVGLIIALAFGWLPSYLTARFSTLIDPFSQASGTGYHISNSLIAIGNGGLLGRGLGNSIMKLGYLPEPHTDFIFSIICEELGLIGGLLVILLLFFIVYRAFVLANKTNSYFYKLVCVGIATYIGIQTFINLGGISGTIPLTGVPLPFISFGGSSMLSLSIAIGLLLIVAKQIKIDKARAKKQAPTQISRRY